MRRFCSYLVSWDLSCVTEKVYYIFMFILIILLSVKLRNIQIEMICLPFPAVTVTLCQPK